MITVFGKFRSFSFFSSNFMNKSDQFSASFRTFSKFSSDFMNKFDRFSVEFPTLEYFCLQFMTKSTRYSVEFPTRSPTFCLQFTTNLPSFLLSFQLWGKFALSLRPNLNGFEWLSTLFHKFHEWFPSASVGIDVVRRAQASPLRYFTTLHSEPSDFTAIRSSPKFAVTRSDKKCR